MLHQLANCVHSISPFQKRGRCFQRPSCTTCPLDVTLKGMFRNSVQTVTFPVLISADTIDKSDGWGTFLSGEQFDETDEARLLVHLVTKEDVKRWLRTEFNQKESSLFLGTSQLKRAYDLRDDFALHRAYETLRPHVADVGPPADFEL